MSTSDAAALARWRAGRRCSRRPRRADRDRGTRVSPVFLSGRNFANLISAVIEVAIMALPMALIIIAGEIDLSVESMAGLSARSSGSCMPPACRSRSGSRSCWSSGRSAGCSMACWSRAAACRRWWSPLARSRCSAASRSSSSGPRGVSGFPEWFTTFGFGTVPGTPIPWPFLVFVGLAIVLGIVLHADLGGPRHLRGRQERRRRPLLGRPGRPHEAAAVRAVRDRRGPRRRDPDRSLRQRPGGRRRRA